MITREIERVEYNSLLHKYVEDYDVLAVVIEGFKQRHYRVAVTMGSWDALHIGHLRYLTKARSQSDILVVGTDTDRVIKMTKGKLRPIIPYDERIEMLSYQGCVDLITPIDDVDNQGNWQYGLLDKIRPDVFIAEETSYSNQQLSDIRQRCGELVVLSRQAEGTSSTLIIQNLVKRHLDEFYELATKRPK